VGLRQPTGTHARLGIDPNPETCASGGGPQPIYRGPYTNWGGYSSNVTVGGNRYGWFVQNEIDDLAIDNSQRTGILSTPGCEIKISDGGHITALNGDDGTFGGNAKVSSSGISSGQQTYQDHGPLTTMNVKAWTVDGVTCSDDRTSAELAGTASVDGMGEYEYRIKLHDDGEPGTGDRYGILIPALGYYSGDQLDDGNIQIH
jgi:hypothetical protein